MRGSDLGIIGGAANGENEGDGGNRRASGTNARGVRGGRRGGGALWDDKAEELLNSMDWMTLTATELDEQLLEMMSEVEHETVECLFAWEHVRGGVGVGGGGGLDHRQPRPDV